MLMGLRRPTAGVVMDRPSLQAGVLVASTSTVLGDCAKLPPRLYLARLDDLSLANWQQLPRNTSSAPWRRRAAEREMHFGSMPC